ncbi:MAG TPA: hypothetical protein VEW25_12170, partial [Allosphingosinicella sp.]|nr:hypothetical protein [Allosphingosinicella sp.]
PGATSYFVSLFSGDPTNPIASTTTSGSPASLAIPPTLPSGRYAVTVRADAGSAQGATSQSVSIERLPPPAALSAAYRTSPDGPTVGLSWQAVNRANLYAVRVTGTGIQPLGGCSSLTAATEFQFDGGLGASFRAGGSGQVTVTAIIGPGGAFPSQPANAPVADIPVGGVPPPPPVVTSILCGRGNFGKPGVLQLILDPWRSLLPDSGPAPLPTSYSVVLCAAADTTTPLAAVEFEQSIGQLVVPSTLPSGPYVAIVRSKSGEAAGAPSIPAPIGRLAAPVFNAAALTGAGTAGAACTGTWQPVEGAEFYQAQLIVVTTAGSSVTTQEPSQQLTASFSLGSLDSSSILHIMILVQAVTQTGAWISSPLAAISVD